jgi:predicted 2-oxoglutarate/Fe(II)-dependent dioxygenase YbiX
MNINGKFIQVLDGLLTPEECQQFIQQLNVDNLQRIDNYMATYDRNILVNEDFADIMYNRVKPYLPSGTIRCNEYFRFSKYNPGQEFKVHTDGTNQDKFKNISKYTINIFLNTEFTGGETDFFDSHGGLAIRAIPKVGRGVVFDREILHCGNKVTSGNKYLLRTDVMIPNIYLQNQTLADVKIIKL